MKLSNRALLWGVLGGALLLTTAVLLVKPNPRKSAGKQPIANNKCSKDFEDAVERVRTLNVNDTHSLLRLYGLYKHALFGKADERDKPWEPTARAKWNAWHDCRDLTQDEAEALYIQLVEDIAATSLSSSGKNKQSQGPTVSKMAALAPSTSTDTKPLEFEGVEEYEKVREDFSIIIDRLKEVPALVHLKDDEDRTLLHWAVDADNLDATMLLVERGADINAKDSDGYTPLGYAASSDLVEIATFLVEAGASLTDVAPSKSAIELTRNAELKSLFKDKATQAS